MKAGGYRVDSHRFSQFRAHGHGYWYYMKGHDKSLSDAHVHFAADNKL